MVGCGPTPHEGKTTGRVTVTITHGGQPVTTGQVDLSNEQTGEGGGGQLNEEGVATLDRVPLGSYTVTVVPPPPDPTPVAPGQTPPKPQEYPNIPEKFRRNATSPLQAEVKEGENEYQFDLGQ